MIALDGTKTKSKLGANAMPAVSMAACLLKEYGIASPPFKGA